MQNQSFEEVQKQNQELKELLLKLNQDKQMFEKKVQRKTQELQKLKQSYDQLNEKILSQKHWIGNVECDQEQLLLQIVDQLILMVGSKEGACENCSKLQQQLQLISEQAKSDLIYYSKKVRQTEEEMRSKWENQIKELSEQNAILKYKVEFLIGKTNFHHEAVVDLNQQVSEVHYLRISLSENQRKMEEDVMSKNQAKIALLEARNSFLVDRLKGMEVELLYIEKLVTNIEQQSMQTKKRGK